MRKALLKARCPSILAFHSASIVSEEKDDNQKDSENENYLQVYLRIKPGIANYEQMYEIKDTKTLISKFPEGSYSSRNIKEGDIVRKKFDFSKIFEPETKQEVIFDELVKPRLHKFINGNNTTLMTYGVSSSGKTYTIVGTCQEPGILPRSLEQLFRALPELSPHPTIKPLPNDVIVRLGKKEQIKELEIKESILNFKWPNADRTEHINTYRAMQSRLSGESLFFELESVPDISVAIWVSFAEIYNEHIYDLLRPETSNGKKREKLKLGTSNGNSYIKNLRQVYVSSGMEAYQVLQYGLSHLNYTKTNINDHSSRSHSIFTVRLAQMSNKDDRDFNISHFNFCDLAGAERCKKTMNVGERLKESNNINNSLLVLRRCITGVRNSQKALDNRLIPFRDSKLTQLFQKALLGQEDICMVVNMNPCSELFDETQHVLSFSAIAQNIQVVPAPRVSVARRFADLVPARSTEFCSSSLERNIKEQEIQELRNKISEYINKIEIEEQDQWEEVNEMRQRVTAHYENILHGREKIHRNNLDQLEIELAAENKRRYKEAKKEYLESLKENYCLSISVSDSSDEEECNEPSPSKRPKLSSETEVIDILSSDEEEELVSTIEKQRKKLEEHHKTIATLKEKISMLKSSNQAKIEGLEEKIRHQEKRIEELSVFMGKTDESTSTEVELRDIT